MKKVDKKYWVLLLAQFQVLIPKVFDKFFQDKWLF